MSIRVFLSPRARVAVSPLRPRQRDATTSPTTSGRPHGGEVPGALRPRLLAPQGVRRRALHSDGVLGLRWLR
jgi:hypothetical protein